MGTTGRTQCLPTTAELCISPFIVRLAERVQRSPHRTRVLFHRHHREKETGVLPNGNIIVGAGRFRGMDCYSSQVPLACGFHDTSYQHHEV